MLFQFEMVDIKKNFCKNLKQWQESVHEGSVNDLANDFGVSQGYMSNILAGRKCKDENWRRMVAQKIGIPYEIMIGLKESPSEKPTNNIIPIDPAIQLLREAVKDAGVTINKKQEQAVTNIIREELEKAEKGVKENIIKYLEAFGT